MAKKTSRRRRSAPKKRSGGKKDKSMPVGTTVGGLVAGYKIGFEPTPTGGVSPFQALFSTLPIPDKISAVGTKLGANATDLNRSGWLLGGIIFDWVKPKKVSRILRKVSKGKVS